MADQDGETGVRRRRLLQTIGAAGAAGGLAGCSSLFGGDGENGDGGQPSNNPSEAELGERVPELVLEYPSDYGPWQDMVPLVMTDIEEALDHPVTAEPKGISAFLEDVYSDQRTFHFSMWGMQSPPVRLDPFNLMSDFTIEKAGPNGLPNYPSYVDCEYSTLVHGAQTEGDQAQRTQMFQDAMAVYSNDVVTVPFVDRSGYIAGRNDLMNWGPEGALGFDLWNVAFFSQSTPKNGDRWVYGTGTDFAERTNHLAISGLPDQPPWSLMLNSPLVIFDENRELQPVLAADYTVEESSTRYVFDLRDSEFHNGDPVTAEAVKWTYEMIEANTDSIAQANTQNYSSIETPDESTVVFTFEEPNPAFITTHVPQWGILHPGTWEEMDAVSDFNPSADGYVGSGPFEMEGFTQGETLTLAPFDGHGYYSPESSVVLQVITDNSAKLRAFRQGEVAVADALSGTELTTLAQQVGEDAVTQSITEGTANWMMHASYPRAPVRFSPFVDAVGKTINREEINQVLYAGLSEPQMDSMYFNDGLPAYPEDGDGLHTFTDDPSGEPDAARQALTDAGWGWDGDGNLRYPAGTDTSPLYPEGEMPSPDEFACIDANGEYVPESQR